MTRSRRAYPLIALLLVALASGAAGLGCSGCRKTGAEEPPQVIDLSGAVTHEAFGSQAILDSCWSADELGGTPADRIVVRRPGRPFPFTPAHATPRHANSPLPRELRGSIRSVRPAGGRKLVALTFDLCEPAGETTGYDFEVVDILRANRVRATFFMGGKWMVSHRERALQLIADPLFEVGNHSWTHLDDARISGARLRDQILWTQAEYESLRDELAARPCAARLPAQEMARIPETPRLYRFPYGDCDAEDLRLLASYGLAAVQWDVVTGDPARGQTAERIESIVLRGVRPGSIVIGHANALGRHTAEALPRIIRRLAEQGYEFATVSELLQSGPAVVKSECYQDRPGDLRTVRR